MSGPAGSSLEFVEDHRRWRKIHDDLWTYHDEVKVLGAQLGRRMVALRRAGRRWALLSPLPLDVVSRAELETEGTVEAIVVPTAFHNNGVPEACEAFPDALVYRTSGSRREGLPGDRCRKLPDDLPGEWSADFETLPLLGMPRVNEFVFHHAASRTLVVSDLCFHLDERYPAWTRLLFRIMGATPGVSVSRLFRAVIRDKPAFLESLDAVLERDFDRLVMSHGIPLETGGKRALHELRRRLA